MVFSTQLKGHSKKRIPTKMVVSIQDPGWAASDTVSVKCNGPMERSMKVNGTTARLVGKASCCTWMETSMKDSGPTIRTTALASM